MIIFIFIAWVLLIAILLILNYLLHSNNRKNND